MTISVSSLGQNQHIRTILRDVKTEVNRTQIEISTGKRAQQFSGLDLESGRSIDLRADFNRIDSYTTSINLAQGRATVMDNAMDRITEVARDVFVTTNQFPLSGEPPMDVIRDEARKALDVVRQVLNTSTGGRFLFAGTDIANAPIDAANAAAFDTTVQGEITAFLGGQSGAVTLANVNGLTDAALGHSGTLAAAGPVSVRIDDNLDADYTVRADDQGFGDIMRGLALLANLEYDPAREADFFQIYTGASQLIDQGATRIDTAQAQLGLTRQIMDETQVKHEQSQGVIEGFIADVEDADIAQAATDLSNLQSQLEAIFSTTASLRDLSLVNFL